MVGADRLSHLFSESGLTTLAALLTPLFPTSGAFVVLPSEIYAYLHNLLGVRLYAHRLTAPISQAELEIAATLYRDRRPSHDEALEALAESIEAARRLA